jgi:hypothetical protein
MGRGKWDFQEGLPRAAARKPGNMVASRPGGENEAVTTHPSISCRRLACALAVVSALVCSQAHAALEISAKATSNVTCSAGVCTATAEEAVLNVGDLENMLADGDVKLVSGNLAQDIDIDAALTWTSTHRLTLDAYDSITFNKPVEVMSKGALTIKTGDGAKGGDFRFLEKGYVKFWDTGSSLVINGNTYALAKSLSQIKKLIHGGHGDVPYIALARKIDAAKYSGGVLPVSPSILEGLGNTISNLTISNGTDRGNVALFVEIGEVRDIGFVNVNILGSGDEQRVGAIAGEVGGAILNSFVTGRVSATGAGSSAGGLADGSVGTVANCRSDVAVTVASGGLLAGGLIGGSNAGNQGQWKGSVKESYSTGTVTGGDGVVTGSLVGYNNGASIINSYATGSVIGGSNSFVGGLAGPTPTATAQARRSQVPFPPAL